MLGGCVRPCMCVCVCVCSNERERELGLHLTDLYNEEPKREKSKANACTVFLKRIWYVNYVEKY